jgi:DNA-damage-inducible protein D
MEGATGMPDPGDESPQQQFDSIRQLNPYGEEYWSARGLMPLLGYEKWERFEDVIDRARAACQNAGQRIEDHLPGGGKMITAGKGAQREIKDFYLSRFGCYLVAMNGDPRKPEIAAAQAYFAVQTRRMEMLEGLAGELSETEQRLLIRQRVISSNKKLSEAAQEAGVNRQSFGLFHDAGYRGLYGGLGVQAIKDYKGIGAREDLLDRMGRAELAANEFRITQTEDKLRREGIQGQQRAIDTHHAVGKEIRETIARLGGTPIEDLPPESSIRPLLDKRTRQQKKLPPAGAPTLFDAVADQPSSQDNVAPDPNTGARGEADGTDRSAKRSRDR